MPTASAVTLRPMTEPELAAFRQIFAADWAADLARLDDLTPEAALAEATSRVAAELGRGLATPGQHFHVVMAGDEPVGSLWFSMRGAGAFLEEVTIAASQRGRGYGRAALVAMEALLVGLGATRVDLHVYAHNPRAFALYERLGYRTTGFKMRKPLVVRAEA